MWIKLRSTPQVITMFTNRQGWLIAFFGLLAVISIRAEAQIQLPSQTPPANEHNLRDTIDGPSLFQAHCAVCHGKDATGGGPAAAALKKRVPDLTRISQRHKGLFPLDEVQLTISGDMVPSPAHGSREMPIWGPIFSQIEWDQDLGKIRIYNLARFLENLQKR